MFIFFINLFFIYNFFLSYKNFIKLSCYFKNENIIFFYKLIPFFFILFFIINNGITYCVDSNTNLTNFNFLTDVNQNISVNPPSLDDRDFYPNIYNLEAETTKPKLCKVFPNNETIRSFFSLPQYLRTEIMEDSFVIEKLKFRKYTMYGFIEILNIVRYSVHSYFEGEGGYNLELNDNQIKKLNTTLKSYVQLYAQSDIFMIMEKDQIIEKIDRDICEIIKNYDIETLINEEVSRDL
jgi:hypothetical protein